MTEQPGSPVQAAGRLTAALKTMSERLEEVNVSSEDRDKTLTRYGYHNRALILGRHPGQRRVRHRRRAAEQHQQRGSQRVALGREGGGYRAARGRLRLRAV